MAKKNIMSKKQQKKLQELANEMLDIAANLVDEYDDLDFSSISDLTGSIQQITQIHEDSPFLDELLKGDSWKKIIKNIPTIPKIEKDDDTK